MMAAVQRSQQSNSAQETSRPVRWSRIRLSLQGRPRTADRMLTHSHWWWFPASGSVASVTRRTFVKRAKHLNMRRMTYNGSMADHPRMGWAAAAQFRNLAKRAWPWNIEADLAEDR